LQLRRGDDAADLVGPEPTVGDAGRWVDIDKASDRLADHRGLEDTAAHIALDHGAGL
jgi:hypothetical protein